MIWLVLILASLVSVTGQLCQKQATRPVAISKRSQHITLWLGLGWSALVWRWCSGYWYYRPYPWESPTLC